jgi:PHD/YefM family antitoxin component YafN of YafNO toxin-antitoxin module
MVSVWGAARRRKAMLKTMRITDTRERLTSLHDDLSNNETVAVTSRGEKILAIMRWEKYEAIRETLAIMGDRRLMKKLRQSIREAAAGKLIPLQEVEKENG